MALTLNSAESHNLSITAGSSGTTGYIPLNQRADHLLISTNADFAIGIRPDATSGEVFRLSQGVYTIFCPIKEAIYYEILTDDAFEVSIMATFTGSYLK